MPGGWHITRSKSSLQTSTNQTCLCLCHLRSQGATVPEAYVHQRRRVLMGEMEKACGSKLTQPEKYTQCHKIIDHNKQDIKWYVYMLTLFKNREEMYLQANSTQDHKRGCILNQENLKGRGWGRDKGIEWPFCGALSGHSTVSVNCELHLKWQQLDRVSRQDKWRLGKFSHKKKKGYFGAGAQGWVYLGQKGKEHWDTGCGRMTRMGKAGSAPLDAGFEKRGGMRIMTLTPRVQGEGALSLSPGPKDLSQEESTTTSSESSQTSADHRAPLIPRNQLRSTHCHPAILYLHRYRPSRLVTGPPKAYK